MKYFLNNKAIRLPLSALLVFSPFLHVGFVHADHTPEHTQNERESEAYDETNSGKNMRDRDDAKVTASDQAPSKYNDVLASIRRAITDDESMSFSAKNIKIMVGDGAVTLRGPVTSLEERTRLATIVARVAPSYALKNELEVK
jgi:hyperosmotically inducible periplasmic protein